MLRIRLRVGGARTMAAVGKRHAEHLTTNSEENDASPGGGASDKLSIQSDAALPRKRPRTSAKHAVIDSSNVETGCGDDGATQFIGSQGDIYEEVITERVIVPQRSCRGDQDLKEKTPMRNISNENTKSETVTSDRYNEPKKYKYFRKLVETSCDLANWRLQERPCVNSLYDPCIICAAAPNKKKAMDCRFYNRMLRNRDDPKLCRHLVINDIEKIKSLFLLEMDVPTEQFIDKTGKPKEKAEASQMAAYVLQCVYSSYEKVVIREQEAISDFREEDAFYNHTFGEKQICDACRFAILNAHFCCEICGSELCTACYKKLDGKDSYPPIWLESLPCTNGRVHSSSMFHLGSFLPSFDIFRDTLYQSMKQIVRYGVKRGGALCNGNHGRGCNVKLFQEEKCYCPCFSPLSKFPIEKVCVIEDQFSSDAYARFKAHLAAHNPIVVENVNRHPRYRRSLWTQAAFEKILACDRNLRVLDSRNFSTVMIRDKPCSLRMFWSKFGLKRGNDDCYMKIKDFPESKLFSSIAPEQYVNLYEIMPFLDYTHIDRKESGRGRLNLLNLFNNRCEQLDPGPKVYVCFGLYNAPHLASTPLHLDVSDAVNFLPFVKAPDEMSREEVRDAVERRLDVEGIRGFHKERALREPEKAGAIWKIFHPSDNAKIRAAIMEWKEVKGEEWSGDVIHNQDVVVTREMMDFFEERGIECRMFVQNEGDVVFIPSGAAHQVQNINSCVKIAEDFVAAEGIAYTVAVTNELRFLRTKDDLVQVDKLLHFACAAAAAVLQNSEPGLVTSSLPQ
ncbi:jmjC domain containing protein [Brugia malayi]|nr:jmjC domain containing protein [Brugia malayi]VIO85897.1 jmjC domain containing protein [Brugia malayi]